MRTASTGDKLGGIPEFGRRLKNIGEAVGNEMPIAAQAVTDYLTGLNQLLDGKDQADFGSVRSWYGRGQQYVSFIRKEG
jgi:hypothetical protein